MPLRMSGEKLVVAIDGPAAAGKGTLARRLAAALDLPYLDTGLLYRAVTRRLLDANAEPGDPEAAERAAAALTPADMERGDLRTPEVDRAASTVASISGVRAALLEFQRGFGRTHGGVLDGRDIGTVIFPQARAKFFVTASVAARAERRWRELQGRGVDVSLDKVTEDLQARDAADVARAAAPLRPAEDAVMLDTTTLDPDQAFARAMAIIRGKTGGKTGGGMA
jgi:cytidylate kinase